jgi:hypothetical protein
MKNTEEIESTSVDNLGVIYPVAPKTHVFYEYQGERAVDPLRLVMDGITLWSEQAHNNLEHKREVLRLWNDAEALLAKRQETLTHSYVEWLRYQITMGSHDPKKSLKQKKPYAYRGMLISAIYFQEAKKLCAEGNSDRVWHIIAMGYYHLGMSTTPSATQLNAKAAKIRHKEAVEIRRALALVTLEIINEQQKKKQTVKNIEDAKDEIIRLIYSNKKALAELERVDAWAVSRDEKNDALGRFRNLLDEWASPNGPHPDIAEALSVYSQKKYTPKTENNGPDIPGSVLDPATTHYMRLVNFFEDGHTLTLEISRGEEAPEAESAG